MRILSTLVLRPNRIEESERIWNREIKKSKTTSAEFRQKLRTVTNAAKKSKTTSAEFRHFVWWGRRPPHLLAAAGVLQRLGEVEPADGKPQPVIEAVGGKAVGAGIEVELGAALGARLILHPAHQGVREAAAAMRFKADEIVDIERLVPGEPLRNAESGGAHRLTRVLDIDEPPARLRLLAAYAGEEVSRRGDVGPQLSHHRIDASDFEIGRGFPDDELGHLPES